jgi:hypothetical protein
VRHTDASYAVPGRTVTVLLYLNPGWDAQVGWHRCAAVLHSLQVVYSALPCMPCHICNGAACYCAMQA